MARAAGCRLGPDQQRRVPDFARDLARFGCNLTRSVYLTLGANMAPAKRKQSRWKPGTVYAVPLTDRSFGIAQAGEAQAPFVNVIYVALFADRYTHIPDAVPALERDSAVSLTATWRQALNRGEWLSLGVAPEIFK